MNTQMIDKRLVVLSGAGMSAESGISVFRGTGGLWEGYSIEEVASPEGWERQPEEVLEFYNQRRKQIWSAEPNEGHRIIGELEKHFDVTVVTQNIDNLHEKAGSTKVVHLHGEIMKARSTVDPNSVRTLDHWELCWGDHCEKGSQLRPHIVWFGEAVPMLETAADVVAQADLVVIVGTSMTVYPAAGLVHYCPDHAVIYCVDPNMPPLPHRNPPIVRIQKGASEGLAELRDLLISK